MTTSDQDTAEVPAVDTDVDDAVEIIDDDLDGSIETNADLTAPIAAVPADEAPVDEVPVAEAPVAEAVPTEAAAEEAEAVVAEGPVDEDTATDADDEAAEAVAADAEVADAAESAAESDNGVARVVDAAAARPDETAAFAPIKAEVADAASPPGAKPSVPTVVPVAPPAARVAGALKDRLVKARADKPASVPVKAPAAVSSPSRGPRKARLRLVQLDAWSVMKTAFLLSIALGIVSVVAVGLVYAVLSAAGVWDSINSALAPLLGEKSTFQIQDYVGVWRVMGFTMLVAVVDVILLTAIATLAAYLYNLAATLLGGIEVTLAEDN